jgi:hypothetical protein
MSSWTFLHLFVDDDGVSRVNPDYRQILAATGYAPPAPPMLASAAMDVSGLLMVELPVGWQGGWHPSPCEQWVICLAGEMGYAAEDGTQFILKPGSCILTTDTSGKGHKSWNAGTEPVRLALVQL